MSLPDFVLEIFSEEIPALMQKSAIENLKKISHEIFIKNNLQIQISQIKAFATPRRLTLYVSSLPHFQKIPDIKKIGPKVGADKKAVEGFLKSVGLENISQLQKIDHNGSSCFLYFKESYEVKISEILQNCAPQIIHKMVNSWPKLMRWNIGASAQTAKWIRPIRNILCLFGSEIIKFEFAGLNSNNLTFGHFVKGFDAIKINDAKDYEKTLKDNFVIVDLEKRREEITSQIKKIVLENDLKTVDNNEDSQLLDEVTGLCEYPTALVGKIADNFMILPDELLILTLKLNQKYFCLKTKYENLSEKFIFISNAIITDSNREKIISDNEKLVSARLADAEFFIHEDLKKPLISRVDDLKKVIFHQKLGSVYDKICRLEEVAKFVAIFIPHCDLPSVPRVCKLSKADLTTKIVGEFPEMQGQIGSFYAHQEGESEKIVAAIYEHYLPIGSAAQLPKTGLGIVMSIADKIDSIVGFFLTGDKPTSSRDPYALRRAALGIIKISTHFEIELPIRNLVEKSLNSYSTNLLKTFFNNEEKSIESKKSLIDEIIKFFIERLKFYLKDTKQLRQDVVNAVIDEYLSDIDSHNYCNLIYISRKIEFLDKFITSGENQKIITLYKRATSILSIEEKKDGETYSGKPSRLSLKNKYEIVLNKRIKQLEGDFKKLSKKGDFGAALKLLHIIELPLSHFFEHVVVNDEDKNVRENRLILLSQIRDLFAQIADFSKIELS